MGGIYSILNKVNGKIYVGQSTNIKKRLNHHRNALKRNAHHNQHLQSSWNKYGEKAFEFNVLEYCSNKNLNNNEIWWIRYFNSTDDNNGYNLESGGNSSYELANETKKKMSDFRKGMKVPNNLKFNISNSMSSTGFFRVSKSYSPRYKQGFYWRYQYYDGDKRKVISSVNLDELKKKVVSSGLEWGKVSDLCNEVE